MSKRLIGMGGKKFNDMLDFMRDLQAEGFTNELDNARVMKALHEKIDEIWARVSRQGSYHITTENREHQVHGTELVVTLHSTHDASVIVTLILFVRPDRDSLAVGRDVLNDEVKLNGSDLPYSGVTVDWEKAKELFLANPRFNNASFSIFKGVYVSLSDHYDDLEPGIMLEHPLTLRIAPMASGIDVKYQHRGQKVACVKFEYPK
jgi:hypothetical protein